MAKTNHFGAMILAALLTVPAWAAGDAPADASPAMPTMPQGGMMMPGGMMPMMHPQMMSRMQQMAQGSGQDQAGGYQGMHPMGGGMGQMMMYPQMMGGGMGNMMMNPQMMGGGMGHMMMNPQMMQMHMQHMQSMEQRLRNIESLLQRLVDREKSG